MTDGFSSAAPPRYDDCACTYAYVLVSHNSDESTVISFTFRVSASTVSAREVLCLDAWGPPELGSEAEAETEAGEEEEARQLLPWFPLPCPRGSPRAAVALKGSKYSAILRGGEGTSLVLHQELARVLPTVPKPSLSPSLCESKGCSALLAQ